MARAFIQVKISSLADQSDAVIIGLVKQVATRRDRIQDIRERAEENHPFLMHFLCVFLLI